jgi:hypothetical protein
MFGATGMRPPFKRQDAQARRLAAALSTQLDGTPITRRCCAVEQRNPLVHCAAICQQNHRRNALALRSRGIGRKAVR